MRAWQGAKNWTLRGPIQKSTSTAVKLKRRISIASRRRPKMNTLELSRCRRRGSVRAGCSAAWQRASFGTKRPPVQIRPPRQGNGRSQGI